MLSLHCKMLTAGVRSFFVLCKRTCLTVSHVLSVMTRVVTEAHSLGPRPPLSLSLPQYEWDKYLGPLRIEEWY